MHSSFLPALIRSFIVICTVFTGHEYSAYGQIQLSAEGVVTTLSFEGYTGAGFTPAPGAGQLDSDTWASTGLSDGPLAFGGTQTSGDHARGITTGGGVSTGGFYALDDGGDTRFMIQPTGGDFSPGSVTLRVQNTTGDSIGRLDIRYRVYVNNNADRASSVTFSVSTDDVTYTDLPVADYTSPEAGDALGVVLGAEPALRIANIAVADGGFVYLRWTSDDVSGSGSRDEIALDTIAVSIPPPTITLDCVASTIAVDWSAGAWFAGGVQIGTTFIGGVSTPQTPQYSAIQHETPLDEWRWSASFVWNAQPVVIQAQFEQFTASDDLMIELYCSATQPNYTLAVNIAADTYELSDNSGVFHTASWSGYPANLPAGFTATGCVRRRADPAAIPTVSEWRMIAFVLLLAAAGIWGVRRRSKPSFV